MTQAWEASFVRAHGVAPTDADKAADAAYLSLVARYMTLERGPSRQPSLTNPPRTPCVTSTSSPRSSRYKKLKHTRRKMHRTPLSPDASPHAIRSADLGAF